jgi:glyoxylase-like metal-dependent hydrolase (beta-lactamase superfamily II)
MDVTNNRKPNIQTPKPATRRLNPGIHRIQSVLGPRPFSQYLLLDEKMLLVDTGINTTPADVIMPWFEAHGLDIAELDYVLISHADVDHCGGNGAIREAAPNAVFMAGAQDVQWIENRSRMIAERYGWYAAHGEAVDYDADTKAFLISALGPDVPIDRPLEGGETIELGPNLTVEVLALPGHSEGHVGLWEPQTRSAIVIDAVLGDGLLNMQGEVIHPPPYFGAADYERTIAKVRELNPARLLTAHYNVMEGEQVTAFLDCSQGFVDRARAAVRDELEERGEASLAEMLEALNPVLGPFTSFPNELAGPILDHLVELTGKSQAYPIEDADPVRWEWNSNVTATGA